MYLDISWGLLSLLKGIGERALPFFFPPKLIISSSAYGHLKDRGVDRDHYAILVGLKFVNASQKPVLVTNVQATFEDEPLETIQTSLSRPGILTTKGWRILDAEREKRLSLPFQLPAADVAERFVFFQMPDITERCGPPAQVALKVVFAWRLGSSIKLAVEETKDASR